MIGALTLLPLIAFVLCAALRGVRRAIVWVLVPSLLLLPSYYTWKLPGIPRFDFHVYALLAASLALWRISDRSSRSAHALDTLVLAFLAWTTFSEFENKGFSEARNLMALSTMGILAPYVIGRLIVNDARTCAAFVACLVLVGAVIGTASVYEARMGSNPFDRVWRGMWPSSVPWDGALYRAGIRRVAGPFAHPICHGFFFSMSAPLAIWLLRSHLTGKKALRRWLVGAQLLGLFASVSRGPILGLCVTLWFLGLGFTRHRGRWLGSTALVAALGIAWSFQDIQSYVSIDRGEARTESQETAAYRNEMLENYLEVVGEEPWIGYGKDEFPVVKGLKSVDNQYLFLALTHGLPAAFLFLAMMVLPIALGLRHLAGRAVASARDALHWTTVATLAGTILTQITVFSGTQTTQVLLFLEGMAVGLLRSPGPATVSD